jgi:MoaD family protein
MPVTVSIPTLLRPLARDQKRVAVAASSVRDAIEQLERDYPGMKQRLMKGDELHRFVNVYVNDEDVRFTEGLATPVRDGDSLTILPAVAGGALETPAHEG